MNVLKNHSPKVFSIKQDMLCHRGNSSINKNEVTKISFKIKVVVD